MNQKFLFRKESFQPQQEPTTDWSDEARDMHPAVESLKEGRKQSVDTTSVEMRLHSQWWLGGEFPIRKVVASRFSLV